MKAIFATIGRKSSAKANTQSDAPNYSSKDLSYSAAVAAKYRAVAPTNGVQSPASSLTTGFGTGDSIGDAPAPLAGSTAMPSRSASADVSDTDWASRLVGTLRLTSRKKRARLNSVSTDLPDRPTSTHAQSAPAKNNGAVDRNGSSHPPSSYRDPSVRRPSSPVAIGTGTSTNDTHLAIPSGLGSGSASRSSSMKRAARSASVEKVNTIKSRKYPPSASRSSFISRDHEKDEKRSDSENEGHGRSSKRSSIATSGIFRSSSIKEAKRPNTSPGLPSVPLPNPSTDNGAMTSEDLAAKLSELAVANGDGLLSDDEYRTLRQGLFEKMMQASGGAMQVPHEPNLGGFGANGSDVGHASSPGDESIPRARRGDSKSSIGLGAEATSIYSHNTQGGRTSALGQVSGFFKRGGVGTASIRRRANGESEATDSGWGGGDENEAKARGRSASSLLSSGDGHSLRPPSSMTHHSASRTSTFSRLRAGSVNRRLQAEALAADMERTYSAARNARSLRAQSVHQLTTDELDDADDKPSAELRAQIAVVQAEGARLVDTFDALEQTILDRHRGINSVSAPPSSYKGPRPGPGIEENETLKAELAELAEKRKAVVKRYEDRLAFLRSKLRSATIREGLVK